MCNTSYRSDIVWLQVQAQPLYWFKTWQPNWISYLKTSDSVTYLVLPLLQSSLNPSLCVDEKSNLSSNPTMHSLRLKPLNDIASVDIQHLKHLTSAQMPTFHPHSIHRYQLSSHLSPALHCWPCPALTNVPRAGWIAPGTVLQRKMKVRFKKRTLKTACRTRCAHMHVSLKFADTSELIVFGTPAEKTRSRSGMVRMPHRILQKLLIFHHGAQSQFHERSPRGDIKPSLSTLCFVNLDPSVRGILNNHQSLSVCGDHCATSGCGVIDTCLPPIYSRYHPDTLLMTLFW